MTRGSGSRAVGRARAQDLVDHLGSRDRLRRRGQRRGRATRRRDRSAIRPAAAATCHPSERFPARSIAARGYGYAPGDTMIDTFGDPARIDPDLESRSVSFENPTGDGAPAAPPTAGARARRRASSRRASAGAGRSRGAGHDPTHLDDVPAGAAGADARARRSRCSTTARASLRLGARASTSSAAARPARRTTSVALTAVQEGRGFNAYFPMPFRERIRIELINGARRARSSSTTSSTSRSSASFARDRPAPRRRSGARTRPG